MVIQKKWFIFLIFFGVGFLATAILSQYFLHLRACFLCHVQRIPFVLLIVTALCGLVTPYKNQCLKIILGILGTGALLGLTHFLIQLGLVKDFCFSPRGFGTPAAFLSALEKGRCAQVTWAILGIPVPLLGMISHGAILVGSFLIFRAKPRPALASHTP